MLHQLDLENGLKNGEAKGYFLYIYGAKHPHSIPKVPKPTQHTWHDDEAGLREDITFIRNTPCHSSHGTSSQRTATVRK